MACRYLSIAVLALLLVLFPGTCKADSNSTWSVLNLEDVSSSVTNYLSDAGASLQESSFALWRRALQTPPSKKSTSKQDVAPMAAGGGGGGGDAETSAKTDDSTTTDDDGGSVLHDDAYYANKTTTILPPEPEPPESWPMTVLIIFIVIAAGLFAKTAYANCKKRSQYEGVPTTQMIV